MLRGGKRGPNRAGLPAFTSRFAVGVARIRYGIRAVRGVHTLSRLDQLTFKGLEGSSEEETTLAEEHIFLKSRLCFTGNG
jgi:hypothetical protein